MPLGQNKRSILKCWLHQREVEDGAATQKEMKKATEKAYGCGEAGDAGRWSDTGRCRGIEKDMSTRCDPA